jgi:hypothetical protein
LTLCGRLPFEKRRSGSMATGGKGVAAQCVALVSAIFAFAVERGLCADNPARGVSGLTGASGLDLHACCLVKVKIVSGRRGR